MKFDVEAAIAEFLADESRSSFELPHMTTGQRKHARKVAEQHTELTCESFGFGADRQLHLFKKSSKVTTLEKVVRKANAAQVSVKNTFIDDWIAREDGDGASDPVVFRSMPPQLPQHLTQSVEKEDGKLDLSPIMERPERPCPLDEQHFRPASPDCSTAASESNTTTVSPSNTTTISPPESARNSHVLPSDMPSGPPPGLLALPPGLEVRNTFIHMEGAYAENIPQRAVQSMPHDMFGQYLQEELMSRRIPMPVFPAPIEAAPTSLATAPVLDGVLAIGTNVMIDGLLKLPAFNGLFGTVQSFEEDSGRYNILLASPAIGHKWAKVKRENLTILAPSLPPAFDPTLAPCVESVGEKPTLRLTGLV